MIDYLRREWAGILFIAALFAVLFASEMRAPATSDMEVMSALQACPAWGGLLTPCL